MFEYIGKNQAELQTNFITLTGDNSVHDTYENTADEVIHLSSEVTRIINE